MAAAAVGAALGAGWIRLTVLALDTLERGRTGEVIAAVADGCGATVAQRVGSRPNPLPVAGFACLGTAGLFARYLLYLIIPQFH